MSKAKQWKLKAAIAAGETVVVARIKIATAVVSAVKTVAVVKTVTLAVKAAVAVKNFKIPLMQLNLQN